MIIFDRFRPYPVLKTVIINLKSGTAFKGVVYRLAGGFVVLRNVQMIENRGQKAQHDVDGEVIVSVTEVDFMQAVA